MSSLRSRSSIWRGELASYQRTVDLGETQFKGGAISENDFLKMQLQLVQYQTDLQQAQLSRVQALSDLRQLLGHETVPADYSIAGAFDYKPLVVTFEELQVESPAPTGRISAPRKWV